MEQILHVGLLLATPVLLAALGGLINQNAGIVNLGLDGMMLVGAFVAVFVDWKSGSVLLGCVAATAAGAATGLLFALPITRLGANQIIAGLGLSILIPGLFGYILPLAFGQASTLQPAGIGGVPVWRIGGLADIPWIGHILFDQDPITYLSWLAVPAVWLFLSRTGFGIRLRASGGNETVARQSGIDVLRMREISTAAAGAFSALGGAQLALVSVQLFNKDMTAGRGYLALAAFYFGRGKPGVTAVAAILFGVADAWSLRLQTQGLPDQLPEMVPYVAVVLALVVMAVRDRIVQARTPDALDLTISENVSATQQTGRPA